MENGEKGDEHK